MSINVVSISGNLSQDCELKQTAGGRTIASFGVAVKDRRKNPQTGEWEDYVNWVDCVMFGNRADAVAKFLTKGTKVFVEGKLHWSSWERDGQRRSKTEVIVNEIDISFSNQHGVQQQGGYQQAPQMAPTPQYQQQAQPAYSAPAQRPMAPQMPQQAQVQQQMPQQPMPQQADMYDQDIPF